MYVFIIVQKFGVRLNVWLIYMFLKEVSLCSQRLHYLLSNTVKTNILKYDYNLK